MKRTRQAAALVTAGAAALAGCSGKPTADANGTGLSEPAAAGTESTKIPTPSGEFVLHGAILQKYNSVGGPNSALARPTASERPGPGDGQYSTFDGGAIYWSPTTGAHILWGGIGNTWLQNGGAGGQLGYPTSDEQPIPGGSQQHFQHGTITYTDGPHITIS
ncbi:hypothetical protein MFM001_24230 [Mycobacterium sp. MFM001]|uniref:LGFP repeat-containing protein n=1 Tax=Mycobacterium sp. MFM001 TaxID=2049453 RepID=UPI000DA5C288|nr:esterase [Mycobacterium sp. MFM001]GBE65961.1 hypothetical protein MFM001_24230 [Mycobacterium sp. MFM001]